MKKLILSIQFLALMLFANVAFGQLITTSTTTTAAMNRGTDTIYLASSTGVSAAGQAPVTGLFIDREYMTVVANVNPVGTGNTWTVKRGVGGIQGPHVSGATIWVGPPSVFDLGANDRVGACTATSFAFLPLVMVKSGTLTYCTSAGEYGNFTTNPKVGTVLASQAGVMTGAFAVTAAVTHVSGTNAITGWAIPPGLPDGGKFTIIPDAAFTVTTATNVGAATTAVAGKALVYTYDKTAAKLYPSY